MRIVPAILTDNRDEFIKILETSEEFCGYNQVDIMDGAFVPSRSITRDDLSGIRCRGFVEAHLMVEQPLKWLEVFHKFGAKRIIFHYEISADKERVISGIKTLGLSAGLAVNPQTGLEKFLPLVDKVDTILFLSVNPGFYGAQFIPGVLDKIKEFKKAYPDKPIGIDGGIKSSNIREASSLGIELICVGSEIFKSENPAQAYKRLSSIIGAD